MNGREEKQFGEEMPTEQTIQKIKERIPEEDYWILKLYLKNREDKGLKRCPLFHGIKEKEAKEREEWLLYQQYSFSHKRRGEMRNISKTKQTSHQDHKIQGGSFGEDWKYWKDLLGTPDDEADPNIGNTQIELAV